MFSQLPITQHKRKISKPDGFVCDRNVNQNRTSYFIEKWSWMTRKKEKQHSDNIKFEKELQLTTCYYTLLLFFAIIALLKIPGINFKHIVTEIYWIVVILTGFALVYQIHIAIVLWKFRNSTETNSREKNISLGFYTVCFIALIVLVSRITFILLADV